MHTAATTRTAVADWLSDRDPFLCEQVANQARQFVGEPLFANGPEIENPCFHRSTPSQPSGSFPERASSRLTIAVSGAAAPLHDGKAAFIQRQRPTIRTAEIPHPEDRSARRLASEAARRFCATM